MSLSILTRPVERSDYEAWRPLWNGYNAFYGRVGETALPEDVTSATWERFFTAAEPVRALVAEYQGRVVGLAHYVFHRSTTRLHDVCYIQDLFTAEPMRSKGVGRQLILAVYNVARREDCSRVYWQTQASNAKGRALYNKVAEHKGFIVYAHEL